MGLIINLGRNGERLFPASIPVIVMLLAGLVLLGCPQLLFSAQGDTVSAGKNSGRLVIKADNSGIIDMVSSSMEYTGNVEIFLGETVITADKVKFFFKKNSGAGLSPNEESIEKIIASGNIRIETENGIATGEEAVYDASADSLVVTGDPATFEDAAISLSVPEITVIGIQ